MTATRTVSQVSESNNSAVPRHRVLTLFGYGIQVRVDRGHLLLDDGIGPERRHFRLPRVGHGLRRLVVIGSDGFVSLAGLRWLADQAVAFVMLDRDGTVLVTTGPVRPSDARLRRAQVMALQNGTALHIARELIGQKLAGQERVARDKLRDSNAAETISRFRDGVSTAETIEDIRHLESQGASAYWASWRHLPIVFPRRDLDRVPEHWRTFGTRKSLLSGSPRLAINPANAMLNYLYAVLESETRLGVAALGLDPGLGFWHVDTPARDSLACDLMEAVRAKVDSYVLDWVMSQPLKREWFFEARDGNCRLMAPFAVRLSETAVMWSHAIAPIAEWVARNLWSSNSRSRDSLGPPTRLTQRHKREAKGAASSPRGKRTPKRERLCRGCGKVLRYESTNCVECAVDPARVRFGDVARLGRVAAHSRAAEAKRRKSRLRHAKALSEWSPANRPSWLTSEVYRNKIQPQLAKLSNAEIASHIGVSRWYAWRIRKGFCPHERHWQELAKLVGYQQMV